MLHKSDLSKQFDSFTTPMYAKLWRPAIISSVGWALSDMADAVVVGQKLGTVGLAAISLILPIYMVNCAVAHGFGIGGSTHFSQLLAGGNDKEAKKNYSSVILVAMLCSILTAILGIIFIKPLIAVLGTTPEKNLELFNATRSYLTVLLAETPLFYFANILNYYLNNDDEETIAGIGSVTGNIVDIGCNVMFVIGFGLGTFGAAISTAIGHTVTICIYLIALLKKSNHLSFVKIAWNDVKNTFRCIKLGASVSVKYIYQFVFFLIANNVLARLFGENGVAVFDLIQNTSYLILYIYEGTSRAMQPIVSTYQGEHNIIGKKTIRVIGLASGIIFGIVLVLFVQIYPLGMCRLFGVTDPGTVEIAKTALRVFTFGAFFGGANIMLSNYYQSCEQVKASFFIETMRGVALLIPFTILLSWVGEGRFFWWLFPATEILTFTLFMIFRRKFPIKEIDSARIFQKTIQGSAENINIASREVCDFCEKWDGNPKQQYLMTLTIEEIAMAILIHGLKNRKNGYIQITVLAFEDGDFEIHLRDNATTFNPFSLEKNDDMTAESDFSAVGVDIIRQKAKSFFYRRYKGFNALVMKL